MSGGLGDWGGEVGLVFPQCASVLWNPSRGGTPEQSAMLCGMNGTVPTPGERALEVRPLGLQSPRKTLLPGRRHVGAWLTSDPGAGVASAHLGARLPCASTPTVGTLGVVMAIMTTKVF